MIQSLRYTVGLTPSIVLQIEALQKKRNTADYVRVGDVSDTLADEARALAGTFSIASDGGSSRTTRSSWAQASSRRSRPIGG